MTVLLTIIFVVCRELNDNQIAELLYKTFANLTNLRALRVRGNRLRMLPTGVFHGLNNLDIL